MKPSVKVLFELEWPANNTATGKEWKIQSCPWLELDLQMTIDEGTYTYIYPFPDFKVYLQDAIAPVW